ncbi:MAG TPA: DUF881 domain-containing protein [Jatrophihabitans sp.]|nr:DUF881 domain-containing protein [Jatrophihabitans sp.]
MSSPKPTVDERSLVSARLLIDLVNTTLDPGYAAAAQRRDPSAGRRRYEKPAVALGCLLIGFMLVVAYIHTNRGAPEAAKVHDRLVARVRAAQHGADDLASRLADLEGRLAALRGQSLPQSGALAQQLQRAQLAAGQTAVTGPGLTVTLQEPAAASASAVAGRGGTTPIEATNILTDRDVRSVVNELWHDGAEAIAVNGVRLTPTSAIRFAGQAVLVDFEPITSPYEIEAVGNADDLSVAFAQSAVASRYQTLVSVDGIGFSFTGSDHLSLPASAPTVPRYAVPRPTASRTGGR